MTTLPAAVTAIPLGVAFGVILERVGLGDPRVIIGQLLGRDFTVVRVMFAAIVVAMLGVVWLGAAGVIDPAAVAMPPTDISAQALGAVIFGGGFALAALCPGTACVAASSGKRDGVAAVSGMLLGTALTPVVWPVVRGAVASSPREGARLSIDLHLPLWVAVTLITVLWIAASMVARRVEQGPASGWWRPSGVESIALALSIVVAGTEHRSGLMPSQLSVFARQIAREEDHVDPLDLARSIHDHQPGVRVIDVREGLDASTYTIPGAEVVPLSHVAELPVSPGEHLVLYSDGGTHAAQAWVLLRARGVTDVKVLKDGLAAWEDEVLLPSAPRILDDTATTRFQRARELAFWFGGHPRAASAPNDSVVQRAARPRRRKTC